MFTNGAMRLLKMARKLFRHLDAPFKIYLKTQTFYMEHVIYISSMFVLFAGIGKPFKLGIEMKFVPQYESFGTRSIWIFKAIKA